MFENDDESTESTEESQDLLDEEGTGEEEETEGEESQDDSESEEVEQSEEDQDNSEEEDEEPGEKKGFKFKDEKTGNFDWQKINKVTGGQELERSFKESQKTITKFSQENKELRERAEGAGQFQQKATLFDQFDTLVQNNPEVRAAVQRAISGGQQQHQQYGGQQFNQNPQQVDFTKIPGINPEDPLLPVIQQLMQKNQQLETQYQGWNSQVQRQQETERFRQGLVSAKDRFVELVGREPSDQELRQVSEQMQRNRGVDPTLLVPGLFIEQIREGTKQKLLASSQKKKALPKNPSAGGRKPVTSGRKSLEQTFNEAWEELDTE